MDGELRNRNRATALAFSRPRRDGLDMRHRLPGLLGRGGGNVAVIADRLLRGFLRPHPPERTSGGKRFGGRVARGKAGSMSLILNSEFSICELERCIRGLRLVIMDRYCSI